MENFEIQSLRNVVKEGGPDVVENFEKKFKEIKIEGKRKTVSSSAMYNEQLPRAHYTEAEIEAMFMERIQKPARDFKGIILLIEVDNPLMVGRDISFEVLNMDLVGPDMKGLGLEEETLQ